MGSMIIIPQYTQVSPSRWSGAPKAALTVAVDFLIYGV